MNSNQDPSGTDYFDADHPIERREQDRLDRRSFAEAIARQICSVPADHGFTIAVVGEWGAGKTSVLNMVKETLTDESETTPILRFNPWLFRGATDLVARFFSELSAQLGQDRFRGLKQVVRALAGMSQALAPLSPVPCTSELVKSAAQEAVNATAPPSLHQQREDLRDALAESESRVVVLIDDIDRLEPREIREMVRLVRLVSGLPNLVFVLAFDRQRIAKSLGEDEAEGQEYLDKIVQVTYTLPAVRKETLSDMLSAWLEELIQDRKVPRPDDEVWGQVFYEVIKPLIGNLRDVKRYINSLPVTLDTVGGEVAIADLLGLEALRVLRPSMFAELRAHAHCLVHSQSESRSWMNQEDRSGEIKGELSAMLERAGDERGILESVFELLFPATRGILGGSWHGPEWNRTWRQRRRVACEEVLSVYLQAGLDKTALPFSEVQALVAALADEKELTRLIEALDSQRLERAIEQLEDFEEDIPVEALLVAVPVLANQMHRLSRHSASFFHIDPRFKAKQIIARLLTRIQDREALAASVPEVLEKVNTLSSRFHLVEMVGHRQSVGHGLIGEDKARLLEDQLVAQLKSTTAKQLAVEWDLAALSMRVARWVEGQPKDQLAARLREHLSEDEFVLTLCRTAVSYVQYNTHFQRKSLHWNDLVETFGQRLADATVRLARSQLGQDLQEDDQEIIELAVRYASGCTPDEFTNANTS